MKHFINYQEYLGFYKSKLKIKRWSNKWYQLGVKVAEAAIEKSQEQDSRSE